MHDIQVSNFLHVMSQELGDQVKLKMTTSFYRFSFTKYENGQWVEEGGHEHSKNMLLYL